MKEREHPASELKKSVYYQSTTNLKGREGASTAEHIMSNNMGNRAIRD